MSDRLNWAREGKDWPNRDASRFVTVAGLRWHVQQMGKGPTVLLLHGTGASTHSWRDLAPVLARHFTVVAPDLPGHGFTERPPIEQMSLPAMAEQIAALLRALDAHPRFAIGHSAGAAILIRMSLDGLIAPGGMISLNGALLPMRGLPGRLFSPLAKIFASSAAAPRLFAWRAEDPGVVNRLLRETGSRLDQRGLELYGRLASNAEHVGAAFAMMARWDLDALVRDLPNLRTPLLLIAASNDRTIPSAEAYRVHAMFPALPVLRLPGLGHLAHEEQPEKIAELAIDLARKVQVFGERMPN